MTSPSEALISAAVLISQGAEAKVYKTHLTKDASPMLLKYRFSKQYRHPSLDATLTRARIAGEARALLRCLRSGVSVPGVRMVDASEGILGIDWIEGKSVRRLLPGGDDETEENDLVVDETDDDPEQVLRTFGITTESLMSLIGVEIAKMHMADIVHGDLTTSNMMLRHPSAVQSKHSTALVLIDFGLSFQSNLVEDKAVDLYVLERAFSSTHPDSEPLFASVLGAYGKQVGKDWGAIERRLDEVRMRGRKRSMVG